MAFDLYEFPDDHCGSKRYVSVRDHKRSIPVIYTYKGADGLNHVRPEYGGTYDGIHPQSEYARSLCTTFVGDIQGFVSPIDGSFIHTRPQLEDHCRQHEVVQVGNERWGERQEAAPMPRAGLDIKRAMAELGSR